MGIKEILADLMAKAGENAYELSKRCGVTQPTINRIITGKHEDPRSSTVKKLATAYGLDESQLRGDVPIKAEGGEETPSHQPPEVREPGAAPYRLTPSEINERLQALETVIRAGAMQAGVRVEKVVGDMGGMRERVRAALTIDAPPRSERDERGIGQPNPDVNLTLPSASASASAVNSSGVAERRHSPGRRRTN